LLVELLSVVVPVYLCAAIGFSWARLGRPFDTALMTDLIMYVGAPCLTFASLTSADLDLQQLWAMSGYVLIALSALTLAALVILKISGLPTESFLAPMVFGNTGNMGLPICYFAFGAEGLALAICFYAVTAFMHFTVGQWFWSRQLSLVDIFRQPLPWATILAFLFVGLDWSVPDWLGRTTGLLGDFTIPIMQITLGVSLARMRVVGVRRTLGLSFFKLGVGAGIGFGLAGFFALEGVARGVLILDCAMPVAVFNYMFAHKFGRDPEQVASLVVVSTLLSFVTLPLLLGFLL
jgi:predicted permease